MQFDFAPEEEVAIIGGVGIEEFKRLALDLVVVVPIQIAEEIVQRFIKALSSNSVMMLAPL